jgi:ABC-type Fe3+ transport system substrate-binding protein
MTTRLLIVLALLAVIIGVPFVLRPRQSLLQSADETLVVISPHNEAIRYEFSRAFAAYYKAKTGRTVNIDWRLVGGTSEIARYLHGEYYNSFRREWSASGRPWTSEVASAYANPDLEPGTSAARDAFLASRSGIGIDIFFGGGSFDFIQQARAGILVDCGVIAAHPDWFTPASIPQAVSGEPFYDPAGRWIGTCLSSFGICYNVDSLHRLGVKSLPSGWSDLAQPVFQGQVALADPTNSGSITKAFEMVIQQQMQQVVGPGVATNQALSLGWTRGLQLIFEASGNARSFAASAPAVPVDVAQGDAAIGMCIDFYGRFQSETVRVGDAPSRLQYFTPKGGSSIGVDPIGMLRGAPHSELAREFIAFVLSLEGQRLWDFKVGSPGGPVRYALRRMPIRKELYAPSLAAYRSDPNVLPYEEAKTFIYHPDWTLPLFSALRFIVRVTCIDPHDEQVEAWRALIAAHFPPRATATFLDVSAVDYATSMNEIRTALRGAAPLDAVRLARKLGDHFRAQYRLAQQLAKEGK